MQRFEVQLSESWPPSRWANVAVLIAVSGGTDSVALARGLAAIREQGAGRLYLAHFNHLLRLQSDDDATFVATLAEQLGLESIIGAAKPGELRRGGDGLEAAARVARYRFLTEAAENVGARYVATAHTLDDQVETILHRILRGTGIAGLAGIRRTRALSPAVTLIRPMLTLERAAATRYLAELGQSIREDATNQDNSLTRNRLRNELLPLLSKQYNVDIRSSLVRLAQQAADVQQIVEHAAEDLADRAVLEKSDARLVIDCALLVRVKRHLVRESLLRVWRSVAWPEQDMGYAQWESLAKLAQRPDDASTGKASSASTVIMLPGNVRANRERASLVLTRIQT